MYITVMLNPFLDHILIMLGFFGLYVCLGFLFVCICVLINLISSLFPEE